MGRKTVWVCVVVALAVTGCGSVATPGANGNPGGTTPQPARLLAYTSCDQLLQRVKAEALAEVGPDGLPTPEGTFLSSTVGSALPAAAVPAAGATDLANGAAGTDQAASAAGSGGSGGSPGSAGSAAAPAYSTTNDQEQGVDEPDLVKTNGQLLVALRQNPAGLQVASLGTTPRLRGFLPLAASGEGNPTGMLLVGNDAVIFAPGTPDLATPPPPSTDVTVVDVTDPDHPVVSHSFVVQGSEVDARLVDGYVELVVDSLPNLPFATPSDNSAVASQQALARNRSLILDSSPADWLPSVVSEPTGTVSNANCTSTLHAVADSGLDTVSVVPIAPGSSEPLPAVTVMGDATTVYASTSSLFVATSPWSELQNMAGAAGTNDPATPVTPGTAPDTTDIHGFDLSDPSAPKYLGSGEVTGTLIGQYALSEYQGYLRVATTVGAATPAVGEGATPSTLSDNRVTILQPQGGALETVATVGGLGSGEKIYAVRFIGPLGFVVTFRQTDPLYVLDLSNPADPHAAGQLALTGYSSFLEPVGDGLLLGIGESVDPSLRLTGLQVSLFDVSDPANPTLVSKLTYPDGDSLAETDPHALLYWAPAGLAFMPLELPDVTSASLAPTSPDTGDPGAPASSPFDGAVALRVSSTGVAEAGRLAQPTPTNTPSPSCLACASGGAGGPGGAALQPAIATYYPSSSIERAVVVGNSVYTVSEGGIMASDLTSFAQLAWLPYP